MAAINQVLARSVDMQCNGEEYTGSLRKNQGMAPLTFLYMVVYILTFSLWVFAVSRQFLKNLRFQ